MKKSYAMASGGNDLERLRLLNKFYNEGSKELLVDAGVDLGSSIAEIGCGHGYMLPTLASLVGSKGQVFGVDNDPAQLQIASRQMRDYPNITLMEQDAALPLHVGDDLDFIYCRLVLIHTSRPADIMLRLMSHLKKGGKLIIEDIDATALKYVPSLPHIDLWRQFWLTLGKNIGASYQFCDDIYRIAKLHQLSIEIFRINQPISPSKDAKLIHALGFQQVCSRYVEKGGATPMQIAKIAKELDQLVNDDTVYVELYKMYQAVIVK